MRVWPVLLVAAVAGCTTAPERPRLSDAELEPAWRVHVAQVQAPKHWLLSGRLAIKTQDDGWTASLQWTQQQDDYQIRVMAPLGQGTVELAGTRNQVTLRAPQNRIVTARDPEALMTANLGWSLPLTGLRFWVRGIPEPETEVRRLRLDPWGRLAELEQSGWQIRIDDYLRSGHLDMPSKLSLETAGLKLRLVVRDWQLSSG